MEEVLYLIKFRDLLQRNNDERDRLAARLAYLEDKNTKRSGNLAEDEAAELARLRAIDQQLKQPSTERVDPLFVAVRDLFNNKPALINGSPGEFVNNFNDLGQIVVGPVSHDSPAVVTISLVIGILSIDGAVPPRVKVAPAYSAGGSASQGTAPPHFHIVSDASDPAYAGIVTAFYDAIGETSSASMLAQRVLSILDDMTDPGNPAGTVDCGEFARVVRCLVQRRVTAGHYQLPRQVSECLDKIQQVGGDQPLSNLGISLPDLNSISDYQIQAENVRLMGPIICAAMFEELKVFQVLDKLVEFSQNGTLITGRGTAGEMLYHYWKDTPNRMSEAERHNIYATTLGIPGGEGPPNREFNEVWIRCISSVSSLVRQQSADQLLRAALPSSVNQQQVRKAARDLAMNLSSRGYGMTLYLALDLQKQIQDIIALLNDREIMACYGARDMWQVIDQVATLELGGARNSARYRTLATCGAIITAWLANNVERYNKATSRIIIDLNEVTSIDPPSSREPTKTPTDFDFVNACELWLADTATSEQRVEELAQPRESPVMTSRPVQIPAIAREMLEQAGVPGLGMGMGVPLTRQ